ncbi:hypothetical protein HOP50_08g50630 [Chloropicon primus]|uniref:Uncharacterized protein n=1 Tax=Chloropicon primus TaxID=1764295 RepID=A0A5B8MSY3_9CHLO|nr:hypothetical protein A3770_08p50380 [Chloropicon primus]UPR01741.1 hypothetical protein HOP50_08g50630 [Chloropicon primus]|mmetsp:Transcript_12914/g.36210  ORF Transcript_12914/g.36210 Transcript_12914/m.36210 type:complete len:222 (-) Transcript_12914:60-725(-)|eukprot:QDZ22520.1 hypothetical protein A3770_08p50380 [Chloropicon primus]
MEGEARQREGYAARVQDFAFGGEPGKLNLGSILRKANEMYANLVRLEQELRFGFDASHGSNSSNTNKAKKWNHLIDLFSMIHRQYAALVTQMRDNLGYWAIYPRRVDQALAMKLQGGMISPKLLVEQEQENEAVVRESDFRDAGLIEETVRHIGEIVDRITNHRATVQGSGVLDPRSPELSGLWAEMKKDRKARAARPGAGRAGSTRQLKDMLEFMRTGNL